MTNPAPFSALAALAVDVPPLVRTNEDIKQAHPDAFAEASDRSLSKIFDTDDPTRSRFDRHMGPHLRDPFRGSVQRRWSESDEAGFDMELRSARAALAAADVDPADVDLLISVAFLPAKLGVGNAAPLAGALGLRRSAWNLEAACAGPLTAMQTASSLIRAGDARVVLVTVSCTYSRYAPHEDTMSWFLGDGSGAFVLTASDAPGVLSTYQVHSADTCGTWFYDQELREGVPRIRMGASERTGPVMRESAEPYLQTCCRGALDRAGLGVGDVDLLVVHTPVAWFAEFAADALGIDPERTVNPHRFYANAGPALTPLNLHYAAATGRISKGDTVLVYGPGSASAAAAVVLRWGDTAVGPLPPGVS